MDSIKDTILNIIESPIVAGAVGALISVLWHKPALNVMIMHVLAGVFSAAYGTQPIVKWQEISETLSPFISLLIGTFAGSLFSAVFRLIHSGKLEDLFYDIVLSRYAKRPRRHRWEDRHERRVDNPDEVEEDL